MTRDEALMVLNDLVGEEVVAMVTVRREELALARGHTVVNLGGVLRRIELPHEFAAEIAKAHGGASADRYRDELAGEYTIGDPKGDNMLSLTDLPDDAFAQLLAAPPYQKGDRGVRVLLSADVELCVVKVRQLEKK